MKIEVGDFVLYQTKVVQESKEDIPTITLTMIKVIEVSGDNGEYFKDKYNKVYDHFRVRRIFKPGIKESTEYEGYDEVRCIQEDTERLNKGV